ncbi:unannotated protein [freshwater metagenome]|jgi:hypothetical protein|uniref:Unannotated protein n=1 Tax=freshwater metagenome TaxID=449393 RepID=A0A6J6XPW2_9ZZZZ|nr:hypothetical protein [Actinomycetota bacterium]MSV86945.1 hypothetical protein [Actinomycetota bacterium]MSW67648.1 hypothetical protein [Actinomycetota bacterium]MSX27812.1 hypothetical protein [Actinomycetota bacterium]MSY03144.1 hypothetical protein [Actinomycetota bacterium]
MKVILSFLAGCVLGLGSALLHNAYQPWGLILSVVSSGVAIWMIGRFWGLRRYKFIASIGWSLVVIAASAPGVGGEILIEGNTSGILLLISGFIVLVSLSAIAIPE